VSGRPAPAMSLEMAAELQDHLLATTCELDRLQALLDDSCRALQQAFLGAASLLPDLVAAGRLEAAAEAELRARLLPAVAALQFQDLATQLIGHTDRRLHHCADRVAGAAFVAETGPDEPAVAEAPPRPNPVAQSAMQAGTVELF
jgi:hypothetical protein